MSHLIPDTMRATITDRFIAAFFNDKCDSMWLVEMEVANGLDSAVLEKAFDLALDAEPILGCRFVNDARGVRWERLPTNQRHNFTIAADEKEFETYRSQTIDSSAGPALQGMVLHSASGDRLLMKIAHEAADGSGAKDAASQVAFLYRQLLRSPGYMPAPNTQSYRSARQLFKWFPKRSIPFIWINAAAELLPVVIRRKTCNPFIVATGNTARAYVTRLINAKDVSAIKRYGSTYRATINDLFITAFIRSIHKNSIISDAVLRCGMTVDLRKWYLPGRRAQTIANLCALEVFDFGRHPGVRFSDTLKKVIRYTVKRKNNWIGLNMYCGLINIFRTWSFSRMKQFFQKLQQKDIQRLAIFPVFSNLGIIERESISFGKTPESATVIAPAAFPPYFGISISGYNGTITISTAVFPETKKKVNTLLDDMIRELNECIE